MKFLRIIVCAVVCAAVPAAGLGARGNDEPAATREVLKLRIMPENNYEVNPRSALVEWQENYIEQKLGFAVEYEFMYFERLNERELLHLALMSGNIPDVFQGYPDPQFRDFIAQGVLRPFDLDRLSEMAPTYYATLSRYGGPSIWRFGQDTDGNQYGVPGLSYDGRFHYVPVIRDDWLREVGIDTLPESLDEFEDAFYAFTYEDPDDNGNMDTYGLSEKGMAAIFGAFGGLPPLVRNRINWTIIDDRIDSSITNDDMRDALRLLSRWYQDGVIDPEWVTGENKGGYWARSVPFNRGIIGFSMPGMYYHIAGPDQGASGKDTWVPFHASQGAEASYTWTKLPVGPKGRSGAPQWGVLEGWYAVYGRQVTDEALDKWWMICELLMSDTLFQDASRNGVPGVQWEYDSEGVPQKIEGAPTGETDPERFANIGGGSDGIDRISHLAWDSESTKRRFNYPIYDCARECAASGNGLPDLVWGDYRSKRFYFDDVVRIAIAGYTDYITGARNVGDNEDWAAFVQSVNDAGLPELTRDAQEWYDAFNQ